MYFYRGTFQLQMGLAGTPEEASSEDFFCSRLPDSRIENITDEGNATKDVHALASEPVLSPIDRSIHLKQSRGTLMDCRSKA